MSSVVAGLLAFAPVSAALGQSFTGTYVISSPQGAATTLVLQQSAEGALTGSFSGNGTQLKVDGMVEAGTAMGTITGAEGGVFFEATLGGEQLTLMLIEVGADNMPDYSKTRTLVLRRGSGTAPPRANPPRPDDRPVAAPGGARSLMGSWSCQTGQGTARLAFLSDRALSFNGERTQYQLAPGVVRVAGDWGPVDYRYTLDGDRLAVTGPDGATMQCQRQAAGPSVAAGSGLEALLQGQICAFSSSPDGGYSTLYKLYFDGQGRFLYGSESSYSGDPGSAYGLQNNPNAGRYQVTGTTKGSRINLTFPDGSSGAAYVFFIDTDNGRILEIQFNQRVYGRSLCQ